MSCPHCSHKLKEAEPTPARCPYCGRRLRTAPAGVVKTSTVRVAAGDEDRVYYSLDEVPPEVRRKIQQALQGPDAETIVIADERGREQIFQVIRGLPPHVQKKVLAAIRLAEPPANPLSRNARLYLLGAALSLLAFFIWWIWYW